MSAVRWGRMAAPAVLILAAGCMNGRPSLLATQAPGGRTALLGAADRPGTQAGASSLLGPSRGAAGVLASSGGGTRLDAALRAPGVGGLKLSSGLSASAAPVAAAGRAGVSITPTLAPAATVGASVAAVSQPLALSASAAARAKAALKPGPKGPAVNVQTGLGVGMHVGGG